MPELRYKSIDTFNDVYKNENGKLDFVYRSLILVR